MFIGHVLPTDSQLNWLRRTNRAIEDRFRVERSIQFLALTAPTTRRTVRKIPGSRRQSSAVGFLPCPLAICPPHCRWRCLLKDTSRPVGALPVFAQKLRSSATAICDGMAATPGRLVGFIGLGYN